LTLGALATSFAASPCSGEAGRAGEARGSGGVDGSDGAGRSDGAERLAPAERCDGGERFDGGERLVKVRWGLSGAASPSTSSTGSRSPAERGLRRRELERRMSAMWASDLGVSVWRSPWFFM
jgi:hypothetical protein